ncbi:zinc metalloproteinase nas-15-like [Actinia tenebrosa]|uniref:Metalloendopeptidase n=1 Tax=Actinia tenebrosa TaxID=6105 RepID=A0A6P8I607_ACTTE|nr:zinc metalloproteinase nas-15-like [Actinia tenebrosa]
MLLILLVCVFVGGSFAGNPDENEGIKNANLFEGDMILSNDQKLSAKLGLDVDSGSARGSIRTGHWPGGVLVYDIAQSLQRDSRAMNAIRAGMKMWTDNTCIRFKQRTNEYAYVHFHIGNGCSSEVGTKNRLQYLSLASGCWIPGIVAHEIGHALGFYHEQSRPDRDDYVTIYLNNVDFDMRYNFDKYPRSTIDSLNTPYDYGSIMHYDATAFGRGRTTIVPKRKGVTIGQRTYISKIDIEQMNLLYKCSGTTGGNGGSTGGNNDCVDNDKNCAYWASKGECEKNPTYMLKECKKSCKKCCIDGDKNCQYWAGIGECEKNADWMKANCKKSCKQC